MLDRHKSSISQCALITGHPGHELRLLVWIRRHKPLVMTLTDGSGQGSSRLELSREVLKSAGAVPSPLFGIATDGEIYHKLLTGQYGYFLEIADRVTTLLLENDIRIIAGDAIEGYNPTHDVCRLLIDRAVRNVTAQSGVVIENYAFPLVGHPSPENVPEVSHCFDLTHDEFAVKRAEALRYVEAVGGGDARK